MPAVLWPLSFIVRGEGKADILREVLFGRHDPERLPAQAIAPKGKLLWLLDAAAASKLPAAEETKEEVRRSA